MKTRTNVTLWILQTLLAALFVFAGYSKLAMPGDVLAQASQLPAAFMQFIAVCELLGGIGLVLPGLVRVHRELTPLAAYGLAIIMAGATTVTLLQHAGFGALVPFIVGLLAVAVARLRRGWTSAARGFATPVLRRAA